MMQTRRRTLAALLAWLIPTLVLIPGCSLFPKEEEEPIPTLATPVKSEKSVYTVKRGDIAEKVILRGRFAPARQQDLYYPLAGRMKAVHVRSGDQVKAGQVLAELHTEDSEYQLSQARIRLEKAQMSLEDARHKAQFTRSQQAQNDIRSRELDLQSAQMELEKYERQVRDSRMVAPFDGQVTGVTARPGETVNAYAVLMTLADPRDLIIEADIDEAGLAKVALGQRAVLEFADIGAEGKGTVVELPQPIATATNTGSQPRRIKVRPESPTGRAAMGSVGRVHVILQQKTSTLLIPNAGIRQYGGRTYVLMREPRREVDVVLGVAGETETEVLRGLKEGDEVLGR